MRRRVGLEVAGVKVVVARAATRADATVTTATAASPRIVPTPRSPIRAGR